MATKIKELYQRDAPDPKFISPSQFRITTPDDIPDTASALAMVARRLGLRLIVWHDLATLQPMQHHACTASIPHIFGWSEAELTAWNDMDKALHSPLLRAARVASEPFWVNSQGIHTARQDRVLQQITVADFANFAPGNAAIIVPVHMPFGQTGAAILTSRNLVRSNLASEMELAGNLLLPAIAQFISGYAAMCRDERYLPSPSVLTRREIQCLSWAAHGKTDYEISIILGCSHAGIRYHLSRACAKLGAVNRTQSVSRACQLGYVNISMT